MADLEQPMLDRANSRRYSVVQAQNNPPQALNPGAQSNLAMQTKYNIICQSIVVVYLTVCLLVLKP